MEMFAECDIVYTHAKSISLVLQEWKKKTYASVFFETLDSQSDIEALICLCLLRYIDPALPYRFPHRPEMHMSKDFPYLQRIYGKEENTGNETSIALAERLHFLGKYDTA